MIRALVGASVIALGLLGGPVSGHHGTSSYETGGELLTLSGTVTEFVWSNPHVFLLFDVMDDNDNVVHWAGEMNSPTVLRRAGWSRTVFEPGDEITLSLRPSKAGAPVGLITRSQPIVINGERLVIEPESEQE